MSWFARLMYRALVWKERKRAQLARDGPEQAGTELSQIEMGTRGETLAYWYLRQAGYTIVARNWRARSGAGELDMVAWDGPILAFVEVKTRTSSEAGPPEAAVTPEKQRRIAKAAREYMRRLGPKPIHHRFDIASIFWNPKEGYRVRLIQDAFKG